MKRSMGVKTSSNLFYRAPLLKSYMMYTGDEAPYTFIMNQERLDECPVCGQEAQTITLENALTSSLQDLIERLHQMPL